MSSLLLYCSLDMLCSSAQQFIRYGRRPSQNRASASGRTSSCALGWRLCGMFDGDLGKPQLRVVLPHVFSFCSYTGDSSVSWPLDHNEHSLAQAATRRQSRYSEQGLIVAAFVFIEDETYTECSQLSSSGLVVAKLQSVELGICWP